ncbi:hypothetical protein MMPV_002089 [Pyropia vietnamensis]
MATLLSSLLLSFARRYAAVDASAVRIGIDGGRLEVRDVALDVAAVAALLPLPFTIVAARAEYLRLHVPWQAITSAAAVAVRLEGLSITAAPKAGGGASATGEGRELEAEGGELADPGGGGPVTRQEVHMAVEGGAPMSDTVRRGAAAARAPAESASAARVRRKRAKYGRARRARHRLGRATAGGVTGGAGGGAGSTGGNGTMGAADALAGGTVGSGDAATAAAAAAAAAAASAAAAPGEPGWSVKVLAFLGLNASVTVTDLTLVYADGRCVARLVVARLAVRSADGGWAAASLPADALSARPGVLRKRLALGGVTLQMAPAPVPPMPGVDPGGRRSDVATDAVDPIGGGGGGDGDIRDAAAAAAAAATPHWGRSATVLRDAGVTARVLVVTGNGMVLRPPRVHHGGGGGARQRCCRRHHPRP